MNDQFPSYFRPVEEDSIGVEEFNLPDYFRPVEPKEEEGWLPWAGRTAARSISRGVEAIAGLPGDIVSGVEALGEMLPELPDPFGGLKEPDPTSEFIREKGKQALKTIPGSDFYRDISQSIFGDLVTPQGEGEEIADEVVSDFGVLALPVKGKIPFARALGTALAGNLSKQTVKGLGGGEGAQNAAKLGTMAIAGLIGRDSVKSLESRLHNEARELIPEGATIATTKGMERNLQKLAAQFEKGGVNPNQKPTYDIVKKMLERTKSQGTLSADELIELRKNINAHRFGKEMTEAARYHLNELDNIANKHLEFYGKKNPEFLKKYREANLATAGIKQSNKIGNFLRKKLKGKSLSPTASAILLHNVPAGAIGKAVPGVAGAMAINQSSKILHRVIKNPVLRKHYYGIIKAAANEQGPLMLKHLRELEKELESE